MKFSETAPELQAIRKEYIHERWAQLSEATKSFAEEAIKYLLVVNTAAMGATLGFFGAMPHLRSLMWPKIVLLLFAFGVAILGVYHPVRYHRIDWLFRRWREEVSRYTSNAIDWNDLIDGDERRTRNLGWLQLLLMYLSLVGFVAGLVIAAANFSDVAVQQGGKDDRAKTAGSTAPATAAESARAGSNPASDTGSRAGPAGKDGRP